MKPDFHELLGEAARSPSLPDTEWIWRRSRRIARRRRLARAMAACTVVVAGWLVLGYPGFGIGEAPRPAEPPTPDTTNVPGTPTPLGDLTWGASMQPGTYRSTALSPTVTMTIPEVHRQNAWFKYEDQPASVDIGLKGTRRPRRGDLDIAIHVFDRVLDPRSGEFVHAPDDLVGWLRTLPSVEANQGRPAGLGGLRGTSVDTSVGEFGGHCCLTISRSGFFLVHDSRARFYFLDAGRRSIAVIVRAPADDFDWFLGQAQPVLDSIRFGEV